MARIFGFLLAMLVYSGTAFAAEQALKADFRHRPPEMVVEGDRLSGPIKDVLEEAASSLGYTVQWRLAPFPRSLEDINSGQIDILPRAIRNAEREVFISFLGPIGMQRKDILFLVKTGEEGLIRSYEDLSKFTIGIKRETAYFEQFDKDASLRKEVSGDDFNLARMFIGGRFDTVAILDRPAMESALAGLEFKNYAYAEYRFEQTIGNYFGMSKTSVNAALSPQIDAKLKEMVASGRIAEIYAQYGAAMNEQ